MIFSSPSRKYLNRVRGVGLPLATVILSRGVKQTWLLAVLLSTFLVILIIAQVLEERAQEAQNSRRDFIGTVDLDLSSSAVQISEWIHDDRTRIETKRYELLASLSNQHDVAKTFRHSLSSLSVPESRTPDEFEEEVESWFKTAVECSNQRLSASVVHSAPEGIKFRIKNENEVSAGLVRLTLKIPDHAKVWTQRVNEQEMRAGLSSPRPFNQGTYASSFVALAASITNQHVPQLNKPDAMRLKYLDGLVHLEQEFREVHAQEMRVSAPVFLGTNNSLDTVAIHWRLTSDSLDGVRTGVISVPVIRSISLT